MNTETGTLGALVQERINADADFQASLASLSDEDKTAAIAKKRDELIEAEYSATTATAKKNEELAGNYKTRAEKAEALAKGAKPPEEKPQQENDLSVSDVYALTDAKVPQEDVEEVKKAAKVLGVSIPEALKDPLVSDILKKRAELRASDEAANRGRGGGGGPKAITDQELIDNASRGQLPKKGTPEAERLFWLRRGRPKG
jgi:hypothetical protein